MKRILSFLLAMFSLVSLFVFTACENKRTSASEELNEIIDNTFGENTTPDLMNGHDSVCVDFLYRPTEDTALLLEGLGEVRLQAFTDKNNAFALLLNGELMEKTTEISLFGQNNTLIVTSDLIGDTAYGITPTSLFYLLMNFVAVSPNTAPTPMPLPTTSAAVDSSSLTLTKEEDAVTPAWISLVASLFTDPEFAEILDNYLSLIKDAINTDIETSVKEDDNGTSFSFTLNNDSAKKIVKELFNEAKEDDDLRDFVSELIATVAPDEVEEAMKEYDAFFENSNSLSDIFDLIDELPFSFTIKAEADKNDVLTAYEVVFEMTAEGATTRLTFYYDAKTENQYKVGIRVETAVGASAFFTTQADVALIYAITENSDTRYAASLQAEIKASGMNTKLDLISVDYNKVSGDYEIAFPVLQMFIPSAAKCAIQGNYKTTESGSVTTITGLAFPDLQTGRPTTYDLDITVTVTYDVTMPKAPDTYKDISTLTEEDLSALEEALMSHPLVQLYFEESKPTMSTTRLPNTGTEN